MSDEETPTLQAQLDEANAKIEALEKELEEV